MVTITNEEFIRLGNYIKEHYGIYLKNEKKTLLEGRLQSLLDELEFSTFSEYYMYLISDVTGEAVNKLLDKITTNHTFFMREVEHFKFFKDKVLPYLVEECLEKDLRIWCAACASGEESYTLAMILDEYFNREKIYWDLKILATDISNEVLETARRGVYSSEQIKPLPVNWQMKYFDFLGKSFRITDRLKKEVIYRKFNLMDKKFPFKKKFHTIFCRNVMIYFDTPTKEKLVNQFYDSLEEGGYLFIGHSESIDRTKSNFKYILPSVYRKE